jgi:hypothetical protein
MCWTRNEKQNCWYSLFCKKNGKKVVANNFKITLNIIIWSVSHTSTDFINCFLFLWVIFAPLDPEPDCESGTRDPIEPGSNPDPDPQHCKNIEIRFS